ncbi:D-glycero-alpha-D-manno-heptose-7-phosphate kinase [Trichlorobacter thiogenes]|uniref:D-glycero-alpha-D-manno-heptose-7-phosphate kinase n=1 Tax=Trichlorobacter thiogenes TaxID=115783 RepID=A0A1T4JX51_9BACT|nr:kinase [Trichlorobacter thiogenes]SJZ34605.1 D-glycero-alpha-D-manno-heptose-7-phosphate kinase [Trichlorobacter thiogenes]
MIITRTPFRISFFGGGTDFPLWYRENGGSVLSTSIDKFCYVSLRKLPPFFDYRHKTVFFSKQEAFNNIDEIQHPSVRETYRFMEVQEGLVMQHDGDLPSHSGLGSSSAFTVGLLHALYALQGKMASKKRLALEAIHIEQDMIKEAVGSQDQVASAFGGLNRIEFSPQNIEVRPFTIAAEKSSYLQSCLVLFFTGFARFAAQIEEDKLRQLDNKKHELSLMQSIVDVASSVLDGDIEQYNEFGKLMHESWMLKKRLSSKVTTQFIDDVYEQGLRSGALGGKILGAGGGGFILFFVLPEHREKLVSDLSSLLYVPFRFDTLGSQVIYFTEE